MPCNHQGSLLVCRATVKSCSTSHITLPFSLHCTVQQPQISAPSLYTRVKGQFKSFYSEITTYNFFFFLNSSSGKVLALNFFSSPPISSFIPTSSLFPARLLPLSVSSSPKESITYLHLIQQHVNVSGSVHSGCDVVVPLPGMRLLEVPQ